MSKADEMFKELGFKKDTQYDDEIHYVKKCKQWAEEGEMRIEINIIAENIDVMFKGVNSGYLPIFLNPEELQAINEKTKELRLE